MVEKVGQMEALPEKPDGRVLLQHLGAITACNTGTIVGLGLGWTSAAYAVHQGAQGFPVSVEEWSWVASLFAIGAAVGSALVGKLVHPLGSRLIILAMGPITMVAWALHLWASSLWMLYLGRFLLGVASGASCVVTPIYVSEMAQPSIRGALSTYFEIFLCLGIFIVYALGKFVSVMWVNAVCLAFSVLHVLVYVWFPDTPRWYLLRGREEDAKRSLRFYRGPEYDVNAEFKLIAEGIKQNSSGARGWRAFTTKAAKKALIITIVLMTAQQVTGVNAISFYATQLFEEAGTFDAYTASILMAMVEVVVAVMSMFIVDRLGRRVLLLASGVSLAVSTGLMGTYFFYKEHLKEDVSSISWMPIILASAYMCMFSVGFGPVVWVFLGEIFPDNVKGVATGVAASVGWFWAFVVTKFYPVLVLSAGNYACYWIFFATSVLSCIFIVVGVPETKGKTLDEIQAELS